MPEQSPPPPTDDGCALCRRSEAPLQVSLTTRTPASGYRTAWACADCAARYANHAALVLALFRRVAAVHPAGDEPPRSARGPELGI